ncbi:hypothetical protein ACIQGZ_10590 [Streptomyces sp. NPDC092296]|uniref:amino acid kinase family protein n=1 Tax=Streptomyces sp. NPDC092296 TaxID=3366012 RepID=UPI003807F203
MTTAPTAAAAPRLLVLKIGGSLLSDKKVTGETDFAAFDDFADLVADLAGRFPGRLVLVTGGGALCHPVGLRIKRDRDDPYAAVALAEPAFTMRWEWTARLRARGVRAVPLQATAMISERPDGTTAAQVEVVRRLLAAHAVPVLSSDCVVTPAGTLRILSSDEAPAIALAAGPAPVRVVALTDVPGILTGEDPTGPVLRRLDPDDLAAARPLFWATDAWDATGAMAGKVEALAEHARHGAECVITRGDRKAADLRHLLAPLSRWPKDVPYTLIARQAAPPVPPPVPTEDPT